MDNDAPESGYSEQGGTYQWRTDEKDSRGFAHKKEVYTHYDNPSAWELSLQNSHPQSGIAKECRDATGICRVVPDIPEAGRYAVYVSYASLPISARDAQCTVHHKGGSDVFLVNQQMGGGTWIYLGTLPLIPAETWKDA